MANARNNSSYITYGGKQMASNSPDPAAVLVGCTTIVLTVFNTLVSIALIVFMISHW